MNKTILCFSLFLLAGISLFAQVGISLNGSVPDASAMLDVKSTTMGLLPPRMTFEQRNAIGNPAEGLSVICTNCNGDGSGCFSIYLGGQWLNMYGYCALPLAPTEGSHVQSNTQIIWNWTTVPIATGYKWNTTSDYASATNMGTATTKTETGRTQGTSYTRYVWAYNACGHSSPTTLNAQALTCGLSFTVNHVAGNVAPVAKIVTYGTVTNIPGETSKCWITRNLGATQQPNQVGEASEAAAGWYWQFNQKQGYKYDITRIPNTTWITSIIENSDWVVSNDPCSILLGSAWRIPTSTEWTNVDAAGNWIDRTGPFSSGLQMHTAGMLYNTTGEIFGRGTDGRYWSSTQFNGNGTFLLLDEGASFLPNIGKSWGYSARCIRDN